MLFVIGGTRENKQPVLARRAPVLAVSNDAFIVYSSNAFAILGLRALYFLLAGMLDRFHYLGKALAFSPSSA
jgi:hypothetical protein